MPKYNEFDLDIQTSSIEIETQNVMMQTIPVRSCRKPCPNWDSFDFCRSDSICD